MKQAEKTRSWDIAASAAIAALVTKSVCSPLERIRLLYQVQGMFEGPSVEAVKYRSLSHTAKTIFREEGLVGFWRGNGANIIRAAVVYELKFGINDVLKERALRSKRNRIAAEGEERGTQITGLPSSDRKPVQLGFVTLIRSGLVAGLVQKSISYPLDLITVRIGLGVNTSRLGEKTYDSIWGAVKRIKAKEGIRGFYKGFAPTLLTGTPYVALQLTFWEVYKRKILSTLGYNEDQVKRPIEIFVTSGLSGSLAGVTAQSIVFPGDTVRKRMMSNGVDGRKRIYRDSFDCIDKIYRREGFKAFYNGLLPMALRAVPSGAIQFGTYELLKAGFQYLKRKNTDADNEVQL